ncbi:MAG: Hsp20/alpha crystallin family protein [Candidatus Bathyarchaeota archaeon]|nr:MAG: Hsp20/alpha crystallin family protein [Candidatus Bathyarchaeota archaeon]
MTEKVVVPPHMFACLDANGENYIVEVDLPGVKKKDIDLNMHEDIVHIVANRKDLEFHGHLHFPIKVDPKKAAAKFSNGLLKVEVPVKEKRNPPMKIEVK